MAFREKSVAHAIDVSRPSVARMSDWLLGGINNFPPDRAACLELLKIDRHAHALARNNRLFVRRVVTVLAGTYGVRQFFDFGTGMPTQDNVHQIAQRVDRKARTVYIDSDPLVLAHGATVLDENDEVAVVEADPADPHTVFSHPDVRALIDFSRPVAALFVPILGCLPDAGAPDDIVPVVTGHLASGSFLALCQLVSPHSRVRHQVSDLMTARTGEPWGRVRQEHEVDAYFRGLAPLPPGLGDITRWRPDAGITPPQPGGTLYSYGGVASIR